MRIIDNVNELLGDELKAEIVSGSLASRCRSIKTVRRNSDSNPAHRNTPWRRRIGGNRQNGSGTKAQPRPRPTAKSSETNRSSTAKWNCNVSSRPGCLSLSFLLTLQPR